jgi:photosystem II stability/assembly factor-like uncharacterized protein
MIEGDPFLFDVLAVNPQTAWAVGIDGTVLRTTDGGKTWGKVKTNAPKDPLFAVASDGKDTIMIGGNAIVLFSVDQGRTWKTSEFKPPIIYSWIYKIAQRGSSGFIAVGGGGAIYSANSAPSWQKVN